MSQKKAPEEKWIQYKVYLPQTLYARIREMAASEGVRYSRIGSQIIRAFFRGVPKGYGDPLPALMKAYHGLTMTAPPVTEVPEKDRMSRVKIGDRSNREFSTPAGLSSQPDPGEDNGPSLTDMTQGTRRSRSPRR